MKTMYMCIYPLFRTGDCVSKKKYIEGENNKNKKKSCVYIVSARCRLRMEVGEDSVNTRARRSTGGNC